MISQLLKTSIYCTSIMLLFSCGKKEDAPAPKPVVTPVSGNSDISALPTPASTTTPEVIPVPVNPDIPITPATPVPTATPTPEPQPEASPTPTPVPPLEAHVWIGSSTQRFIAGYDTTGKLLSVIDLSKFSSTGGIGSLTFLDKNLLLVFLDPGASNERYVLVDVESKAANPGWFSDPVFTNTTVGNTITQSNDMLFAARSTGIEQMLYNLASGFVMRVTSGWPIVSTVPCPVTTIQYTSMLTANNGNKSLLVLSSGSNTRLNVVTGISSVPTCVAGNSYNYTTSYPSNAAYVALAAVQMPNNKVYVRYQHATTPRIVSYDFDGVALSNGADVFTNVAILSNNIGSRELIPYDSSSFLLSDWSAGTIHRVGTDGTYKGVFIRDGYTATVSTMAIRPE